jgi:hypothetical protein
MNRHPGARERSWWTLKTYRLGLEITGAVVAAEHPCPAAVLDGHGVPAARTLADGRRLAGHLAGDGAGGGIAGHEKYLPGVRDEVLFISDQRRKEKESVMEE